MTTSIPELQFGDHLTRAEFERRYAAMPHLKKAELIEGRVFVGSPVRDDQHGHPHALLVFWLTSYWAKTPGLIVSDNATVRLDLDNEPQPDALLRVAPERGGQSTTEGGYVIGAPELVAEVSATSASYDLHEKLTAYRRNGVQEYVVWRVLDRALDWFVLREGRYDPLELDAGLLKSAVFPGLWLDPQALLTHDGPALESAVQRGLASDAHAAFVARLQSP